MLAVKEAPRRRFRSDLRLVWERELGFPGALLSRFKQDLRGIYKRERLSEEPTTDEYYPAQLTDLAKDLEKWGAARIWELEQKRSALPADHPVKCPISLFGTMDAGRLEVAHTTTLAFLMHPHNPHGFGPALLKALLRIVPGAPKLNRLRINKVEAERLYRNPRTGEAGRLDIWIEGGCATATRSQPCLVVIEAKVDAEEDYSQLARYDSEIKRWLQSNKNGKAFRIFLTPEGTQPYDSWPII